jgi:hypothetical protein
VYLCGGCHDVNTVCVLFLGDARDVYRGLPGLSRLSRVDHWMITQFSRGNLGGSLQYQLYKILNRFSSLNVIADLCNLKKKMWGRCVSEQDGGSGSVSSQAEPAHTGLQFSGSFDSLPPYFPVERDVKSVGLRWLLEPFSTRILLSPGQLLLCIGRTLNT